MSFVSGVSTLASLWPLRSIAADISGNDTDRATYEHNDRSTPVMAWVSLNMNGSDVSLPIDTRTTLLDALREQMHLTSTKKGCDHGQCGACTTLVNGRRPFSACASAPTKTATGWLAWPRPYAVRPSWGQLTKRKLSYAKSLVALSRIIFRRWFG